MRIDRVRVEGVTAFSAKFRHNGLAVEVVHAKRLVADQLDTAIANVSDALDGGSFGKLMD